MKQCSKCKELKEDDQFNDKKCWCKDCVREYSRIYMRERNKKLLEEKIRVKKRYENNRVKCLERTKICKRKRVYGLDHDSYLELIKKSEGKCAICKQEYEKPCVDHDHKTGKVRGILCGKCNVGIGYFYEKIENLESAIEYLKDHGKMPINTKELNVRNKYEYRSL